MLNSRSRASRVVHSTLLDDENYLELRLDEFLDRVAAGEQAPGGGSGAAYTVAVAAGLVAMVARCSREAWGDARGVAAQALSIQDRVAPLASVDARAWEVANEALRQAAEAPEGSGDEGALERKLEEAAAVPLEIAQLGADVAELAVIAADRCDGEFRADAAAAAALAAGGARAAAHLVSINLAVRDDDVRLARARASERAAAAAAERILGPIR